MCAKIKRPNKNNCINLAKDCPVETAKVGCSEWKLTAKSRKVTRKLVRSKKRIRAKLEKMAAQGTYKRVFCALALKKFQTDICNIVFNKVVAGSGRVRRLEEADWLVVHELSSSSSATLNNIEADIQKNTFDTELISDLKIADTTSFASTTIEDKGIVTEIQTIEIFEVNWEDQAHISDLLNITLISFLAT